MCMHGVRYVAPIAIFLLLSAGGVLLIFTTPRSEVPVPVVATMTDGATSTGVAVGDTIRIDGVNVTIDGVLEDSRCPKGVSCIQAGTVRLVVTVQERDVLATGTLRLDSSVLLGPLELTLRRVSPEPIVGAGITNYRFLIDGRRAPIPEGTDEERATTTPASPSGIRGVLLLSPSCPVDRTDLPCPPSAGAGIMLSVFDEAGREVARTRTDSDGKFFLLLSPGMYTLENGGKTPFPSFSPISVKISEGEFTDIAITADSGIR